jgi:hypothetical protein
MTAGGRAAVAGEGQAAPRERDVDEARVRQASVRVRDRRSSLTMRL